MNEIMNTSKGNDEISADSVQLVAGQKFHHQASNGVTYFRLQVEQTKDGSLFPMTMTAPACNVLPIEIDTSGQIIAAYFLSQGGRPEMGEGAVALKAAGSFCGRAEPSFAAGIRSLREKLGIHSTEHDLVFVGQSYGFGDQFQFPIDLFIVSQYTLLDSVPMEGCVRMRMTIADIAKAQRDRLFFNSETVDLIATVLLRNHSRDLFAW